VSVPASGQHASVRPVRSLRARDVRPETISDVPYALRSNSETIKGEGKDGCIRLALCVRPAVGDERRRNASAPNEKSRSCEKR
jgi:hypothetical protein